MKKKELSLKEIQFEEKEMLKELISFLDKNNINYYIWAGSFLGAIRHKGFIPWDDDVDIAIDRNNYNKLINIILSNSSNIDNNLTFIGYEINKGDNPYIKLINKKILIEEKAKYNKYLWVDIFPLDAINKNKLYWYRLNICKKLLRIKRDSIYSIKNDNSIKSIIKRIIAFFINYKRTIKRFIKICSYYSNGKCDYITNSIWGNCEKEMFDKSLLEEYNYYQFEDLKVKGIKKYDIWLKKRYGNYMDLPPLENRNTHSIKAWRNENDE